LRADLWGLLLTVCSWCVCAGLDERLSKVCAVSRLCCPGFFGPALLPGFLFMSLFVTLVVLALGDNYASRLPLSCQPSAPDDTSPSLCPSSETQIMGNAASGEAFTAAENEFARNGEWDSAIKPQEGESVLVDLEHPFVHGESLSKRGGNDWCGPKASLATKGPKALVPEQLTPYFTEEEWRCFVDSFNSASKQALENGGYFYDEWCSSETGPQGHCCRELDKMKFPPLLNTLMNETPGLNPMLLQKGIHASVYTKCYPDGAVYGRAVYAFKMGLRFIRLHSGTAVMPTATAVPMSAPQPQIMTPPPSPPASPMPAKSLCTYRGVTVPARFNPHAARAFATLEMRPNDVILATHPRCGTTWVHKVIHSLLHVDVIDASGRLAIGTGGANTFGQAYPEFLPAKSLFDAQGMWMKLLEPPSGASRLFTTHSRAEWLPAHLQKTGKLVLVLRNPKDVLVSSHHFTVSRYDGCGLSDAEQMAASCEAFLAEGAANELPYGSYMEHLRAMGALCASPAMSGRVHLVYYERMHEDPLAEIGRLADFLGVRSLTMEQLHAVCSATSFERMKAELQDPWCHLLRTGMVGEWRMRLSTTEAAAVDDAFDRLGECAVAQPLKEWM
jgi:hypothetical protein